MELADGGISQGGCQRNVAAILGSHDPSRRVRPDVPPPANVTIGDVSLMWFPWTAFHGSDWPRGVVTRFPDASRLPIPYPLRFPRTVSSQSQHRQLFTHVDCFRLGDQLDIERSDVRLRSYLGAIHSFQGLIDIADRQPVHSLRQRGAENESVSSVTAFQLALWRTAS